MVRTSYQLLKNNEPIALGSMTHCLDVFYWEIYYGCDHLLYNIVPIKQDEEVYRKAKAFDEIKERFEKEYKAEVFEESLYHPENFDNSEFLIDVEHILYFEDVRYVEIEEDGLDETNN